MTQSTPLSAACARILPRVVEELLLAGASIVHPDASFLEYHHPFCMAISLYRSKSTEEIKEKQMEMALMLLACGMEPWFYPGGNVYSDYELVDRVAKVAEKWLESLSFAQICFTKIFGDPYVGQILSEFLYKKKYL